MGEKVIVVLDRSEALILADMPVMVKDIEPGLWTNTVDAEISGEEKLRAALDRDRDELVRQLARLIDDGVRGRNGSVQGPEDLARAVLAVIEGADHAG